MNEKNQELNKSNELFDININIEATNEDYFKKI